VILPLYMQLYNFIFKLFIDVIKKKLLFLSNIKSRMLQRIQTLYLLLAAICSGGLSQFLPVRNTDASIEFAFDSIEYMILFSASALLSLISIFLFKTRQTQFVLGRLNIILNLILLGLFIYRLLTVSGETANSEKGIGLLLPILSIVLLVFANKAIKNDEALVKSVDRLR
jgi:small-conductance mechanosensitive channel